MTETSTYRLRSRSFTAFHVVKQPLCTGREQTCRCVGACMSSSSSQCQSDRDCTTRGTHLADGQRLAAVGVDGVEADG